jgi:uncharacterized protein
MQPVEHLAFGRVYSQVPNQRGRYRLAGRRSHHSCRRHWGPEIIDALRRIAPVTAIRGNVDTGEWARQYADTELLRIAGKSIYVLHDLKTLGINSRVGIDAIVSGHSHVPKIEMKGSILHLNPGSAGPRRFKLPITLATLEVMPDSMRPEIHDLGALL